MNAEVQDASSANAIQDRKVAAWIEGNIGGTFERFERQSRWRGGWWVDVRRDGELIKLYVREERKEEFPPWPLEHEAGVLQILEKHGVPVPHIYGICEDPHAIVMSVLPGGLDFGAIQDEEERISVLHHYAEVVAKMHAIDPEELVKIGATMPTTDEEISLACYRLCEDMYLKGKKRPDPRIEFLRLWIQRNIPKNRKKVSIIAVDSGQFLFDGGKVTGLYDLEYGCLGDPMIDLAFIPSRTRGMGIRDIKPFFERYAEITGDKFELDVLVFHRVWWGVSTPMIITPNLHQPPSHATYFEYIGWYVAMIMGSLLTLGELKGLTLDGKYEVKPAEPSRWAPIFDVMAARIPEPVADEPYETTEQRGFMEFAKRMDSQRSVEEDYVKEVEQLLGRPVRDWKQADEELEKFIISAGPEYDDALITLLYRWTSAQARAFIDWLAPSPEDTWPRFSQLIA